MRSLFGAIRNKALKYGTNGFLFLLDGVFVNAATILTTGAFISGIFVYLKAPDSIVGIVNTANVWATAFALASCFIFNKVKNTKRFLILSSIVARTMICSIVILPHIFGFGATTVGIAAFLVIGGNIVWSVYAVGANIWLMATIPREDRSTFVYLRSLWLRISFALTSIVMGFVLDAFGDRLAGFTLVFALSFVFSISDILVLLKIPYTCGKAKGVNTMNPSLLVAPFRDRVYRNYLIFTFVYYMSIYASASFTSLYLIKYMGFSYKYISIATVLCHVLMIVSIVFWKGMERKNGAVFVLRWSAVVMGLEQFAYGFLFQGNFVVPFIAAFFAGIGSGGFNIIIFSYRYSIMPENNATNYETWFMVIHGLGIIAGPIVGNILRPVLAGVLGGTAMLSEFQAMYFIASAAAFAAVLIFFGKRTKRTKKLRSNVC